MNWCEMEKTPYAGLQVRVLLTPNMMEKELTTHKCATCKKIFEAHPEHRYRRDDDRYRAIWFCSYKCLRSWERKREAQWDSVIHECFEELEFLDEQSQLPAKERDPRVHNLYRQTEDCHSRLNTAIVRKMKGYS